MQQVQCQECEEWFGLTVKKYRELLDSGDTFYCPSGHRLHYRPTKAELGEEVDRLKIQNEQLGEENDHAWAAANKHSAEVTQARRAVGGYKPQWMRQKDLAKHYHEALGGVCLVCQRKVKAELAEKGVKCRERPR